MKLRVSSNVVWMAGFVAAVVIYLAWQRLAVEDARRRDQPAEHDYPAETSIGVCDSAGRVGRGGATNDLQSPSGFGYSVRAPGNYRADVAHPLLMVYAPGGRSRAASERLLGITRQATAAGFIVAFADDAEMSVESILALGRIPNLVADDWCIDRTRVFMTGHSNGGLVSNALTFLEESPIAAAAIAPSAAGLGGDDLANQSCPDPTSVMVLHSRDDRLFPGLGAETAAWWAACNKCDGEPRPRNAESCVAYENCEGGVETLYCEGEGPHTKWPNRNSAILEFLSRAPSRQLTGQ